MKKSTEKLPRNKSGRGASTRSVGERKNSSAALIRTSLAFRPSFEKHSKSLGERGEESVIDELDELSRVEPRMVTSCVINVCSTRRKFRGRRDEAEDELHGTEDEPIVPLPAFYKHPFPEGLRFPYLIPRSREEWLDYLVWLVKQRISFKYLTDQ